MCGEEMEAKLQLLEEMPRTRCVEYRSHTPTPRSAKVDPRNVFVRVFLGLVGVFGGFHLILFSPADRRTRPEGDVKK